MVAVVEEVVVEDLQVEEEEDQLRVWRGLVVAGMMPVSAHLISVSYFTRFASLYLLSHDNTALGSIMILYWVVLASAFCKR